MKQHIIYILVIILLIIIILFQRKNNTNYSVIEKTTIDTLYITDSIFIEKPKYINKYITHYITDTVYSVDSILVPVKLPIEKLTYSDSTDTYKYQAIVSGYKASLDELNIYTTTPQYNTIQTKYKPNKWSISIGASLNIKGQLYPSINIGYNIFSW